MTAGPLDYDILGTAMQVHLLGRIDFARAEALQQRLAAKIAARLDGQICLLLCEHPDLITIGRDGSPGDVQLDAGRVRSGQLQVRWVKRGGGCLVHAPGQLAVYPIVPLRWYGFSVGDYLGRLQRALRQTLQSLEIPTESRPGQYGLWGRTGQVSAIGVAVRDDVTSYGAYVNVNPPMGLFRLAITDPRQQATMSCLVAERRQPVKMTTIRAEVVRHLAESFGCDRYHMHTGHPLLRSGEGRVDRVSPNDEMQITKE